MSKFGGIPVETPPAGKSRFGGVPVESGEHDFDAGNMVRNIPDSAAKFIDDVTFPIRHPIQTYQGIRDVVSGGAQQLAAGRDTSAYANPQAVQANKAVRQAMIDRYGGIDQLQKTLEEDPVGFASDIAGVLGVTAKASKLSGVEDVARAIDPANAIQSGAKVAGKAAGKLIGDEGLKGMYGDAAKFSTTLDPAAKDTLSQTAVDNQIMPTYKGTERLSGKMQRLGERVGGIIDDLTASGEAIPKGRLLGQLRKEMNSLNPRQVDDFAKVKKQWGKVLDNYGRQWADVDTLSPRDVQNLKVDIDKALYPPNRQTVKPFKPGTEQAKKAMRDATRAELEMLDPEIGNVNRELAKLKELEKHLTRSAGRVENRNPVGIDAPLQTTAGAMVGGPVGAVAGGLIGLMQMPKPRAAMVLALKRWKDTPAWDMYIDSAGKLTPEGTQALILLGRQAQTDQQDSSQP